jgi:hypothetical protein
VLEINIIIIFHSSENILTRSEIIGMEFDVQTMLDLLLVRSKRLKLKDLADAKRQLKNLKATSVHPSRPPKNATPDRDRRTRAGLSQAIIF